MSHVGLLVRLEAKPEKAEELADFLKGALPAAENEPGTASWFALRIGPTRFGIYDSFPDDTARQKHLSGPIAAACGWSIWSAISGLIVPSLIATVTIAPWLTASRLPVGPTAIPLGSGTLKRRRIVPCLASYSTISLALSIAA